MFLPRTAAPVNSARPEIPNIESDDEPEQSFVELQAITMVWAQFTRGAGLG